MKEEIKVVKDIPSLEDEDDIDDDEYWEKKLPDDYKRYIRMSDTPLQYTSKKELYLRLCDGFLGDNGQMWFSLCKSTGGICCMLGATKEIFDNIDDRRFRTLYPSESRFGEVKKLERISFTLKCRLRPPMFSPKCTYACYLVFKFEDHHDIPFYFYRLLRIWYTLDDEPTQGEMRAHLHFTLPLINIPTIKPNNGYGPPLINIQRTDGLIGMPKGPQVYLLDTWMEERKDGWMEVMLCKSLCCLQDHTSLELIVSPNLGGLLGFIMEGVEFRPCI